MRPGRAVLETDSGSFDVLEAMAEGGVDARIVAAIHPQILQRYCESHAHLEGIVENAIYEANFKGCRVEVVVVTWLMGDCSESRKYVIAPDRALAEAFVAHVCQLCSDATGKVLVFEHGQFKKDETLFQSVRRVSLDSLVLRGHLKDDIVSDVTGFFAARDLYARYRVPYKRGILLYGPPGNGKTHFLKALIAGIDAPCLYVKSLLSQRNNDHESVRRIFERARAVAPCLLVFEDLDTVLRDENRSFFLNELDGFADNTGVVVLATTNNPERIDPAIIDRPSRFDRKYLFDLPGPEERRTFVERWSASIEPEMRLSADGLERVTAATHGFSFAYLKELVLSATMAWIKEAGAGTMDRIFDGVLSTLKDQAQRGKSPGQSRSGRRVGLVPEA